MKNFKHLLFITISFLSLSTYAQTSKKTLNYQAVILDPKAIDIPGASITGQPLNKGNVCLRFSLLNAQGGLDYEETQQVTTDEFGLVSVAIGTGSQGQAGNSTSVYKSFESIVWNASVKSLKVSVSYDACASFKQVSTQVFNYTPYALYAEAVDYKNVREAPTKLSQFSNDAGFLIPKDLDPLKTDIQSNSSKIATANQNIADNKQASDAAFLVVNQSISSLDKQVAENTNSITTINTKLTEQQNQIVDNRNQIAATNNTMNAQIGGLQGQLNITNSTVSNLSGVAEMQSNKSTAEDLGGANPSDQAYPSQKATKTYVDLAIYDAVGSGVPDATTLAAGKVKLSGDLGGTAMNPTVPALANKANIASPAFTGVPTAPTPASSDNSTKIATTAFVQAATAGIALQAAVDAKANIASPAFTGTPTAPTPTLGDNSTKLATTAYVDAQVSAGAADASSSTKGIVKLAGDLGGTATSPTVPGLTLKEDLSNKSNGALGTSTTLYPTQNAVKTYVDAQVASATIVDADATTRGKIQLAGDLGGSASSPSVLKIRGTSISSVAPVTAGHVLTYDASGGGVAYWAAPQNSANTISGIVPVSNGGTGLSSVTSGGAVYATSSSALATGTLPLTAGGTGETSQQAAINALTGSQTSGRYLRSDGTDARLAAIQAADVPTLNQNTTGNAATATSAINFTGNLTGDVTGTQSATVVNKINGTSLAGLATGLLKNTTTTGVPTIAVSGTDYQAPLTLTTTGTGAATLSGTTLNIPSVASNVNATGISGTVAVANGGTGATTATTALANLTGTQAKNTIFAGPSSNIVTLATFDGSSTTGFTIGSGVTVDNTVGNPSPSIKSVGGGSQYYYKDFGQNFKNKIIEFDIRLTQGTGGIAIGAQSNGSSGVGLVINMGTSNQNGLRTADTWGYPPRGYDTYTFNANTWYSIKIITDNGTAGGVTWYVNGTLVGNSGSTSIGTGTYFGFTADYSGTVVNFDNLTIKDNSGSAATPTFRALVADDIPTVNATSISGTVSVANGGTGANTLTQNNVLLGNGTSALQVVAPGASGNVLTSNGTTWSSSAPQNSANTISGVVSIEHGGTGATSAANALTLLGAQSSSNLSTDITADATSTTKYPAVKSIKDYVDASVTSGAPDASTITKGKIQLGGDLAGTSSSASAPIISNLAISTAKLAADAVTSAKILDEEIVNADISSTAAIVDTKLATISTSGKVSNTATTATNANTASAIVARDASGNFTAGTITANLTGNVTGNLTGNVSGNASTATSSTSFSGNLTGDVTGTQSATVVGKINGTSLAALSTGLLKNTTTTGVPSIATAGTDYAAGTSALATGILKSTTSTGALSIASASDFPTLNQSTTGNAATATKLAASKNINSVAFDGSSDITVTAAAGTLTGTSLNSNVVSSSLTSVGTLTNLTVTNAIAGSITGTAANVTGTVAVANGGTGATTAATALTALGAAPVASPTFTGTVTSPIYASTPQTLTDAATIYWNPANGLNASVTLGGNRTLNFSSTPASGSYGTLVITQDATGGRTITLPSTANKVLGSTSTTTIALSTAAGAKDILNFYYDGTNCFWNIGQGYGTASTSSLANLATGVTGTLAIANGGTGVSTSTGSGSVVLSTSPTLVTPDLGTPSTLVGTNITGTASGLTAGNVTTNANLTGDVTSVGNATTIGSGKVTNSMLAGSIDLTSKVTGILPVANGGTGATTLTGYVKGSGTSAMTASASIPVADVSGAAPLASPALTGTPTAPTATSGDNTTQIATTAFVTAAVAAGGGGGGTTYTTGLNSSLGGYVFYVTPDMKHGLVAETYEFDSPLYLANDKLKDPTNHSTAGKNFMDWRVPTLYELTLMYNMKATLNMDNSIIYWSSTWLGTYSANSFLNKRMSDGVQYDNGSDQSKRIKAVRTF